MNRQNAQRIIDAIIEELTPLCQRIEVVGAMRRVLEIEIECIELVVLPMLQEQADQPSFFEDMGVVSYIDLYDQWEAALPRAHMVAMHTEGWLWNPTQFEKHPPPHPTLSTIVRAFTLVDSGDSEAGVVGEGGVPVIIYRLDDIRQMGVVMILATGDMHAAERYMNFVSMRRHSVKDFYLHGHMPSIGRCTPTECLLLLEVTTEHSAYLALGLPYIKPDDRTREVLGMAEKIALGFTETARY